MSTSIIQHQHLLLSTLLSILLFQTTNSFITPIALLQHPKSQPPPFLLYTTNPDSSSSSSPQTCVVQRLNLSRQFERYCFLQDLLEPDVESNANDINEVIYRVLKSYLDHPPSSQDDDKLKILQKNNRRRRQRKGETGPEIDEDARDVIRNLVRIGDDLEGKVPLFKEPECVLDRLELVNELECLLPSEEDDQDAYMSLWEIVTGIHGGENVKMNRRDGGIEWDARCIAARFLIHYDFLSDGIVEEPFA